MQQTVVSLLFTCSHTYNAFHWVHLLSLRSFFFNTYCGRKKNTSAKQFKPCWSGFQRPSVLSHTAQNHCLETPTCLCCLFESMWCCSGKATFTDKYCQGQSIKHNQMEISGSIWFFCETFHTRQEREACQKGLVPVPRLPVPFPQNPRFWNLPFSTSDRENKTNFYWHPWKIHTSSPLPVPHLHPVIRAENSARQKEHAPALSERRKPGWFFMKLQVTRVVITGWTRGLQICGLSSSGFTGNFYSLMPKAWLCQAFDEQQYKICRITPSSCNSTGIRKEPTRD